MKKEEFLAFSLPYGLKVYDCVGKSIELVDYSKGCPKCICEEIGKTKNENKCVNVFQAAFDKQLKPVLHPLSDLTKQIEHNGEKFVPIVELAKIGFNLCTDLNIEVKSKDNMSGCKFYTDDDEIVVFVYHWKTQSFCAHYSNTRLFTNTYYQLKMFQKLIEWKFDVADLLDRNEAICVNTLEINPYK